MERFTFKKRNVLREYYMYVAGANAHNRKEHLGKIEDVLEKYEIDDLQDLDERLHAYKFLANHEYSCVDANAYNIMLKDLEKYHKAISSLESLIYREMITKYENKGIDIYWNDEIGKEYVDIKNRLIALKIIGDMLNNLGIKFNVTELPHENATIYEIRILDRSFYVTKEEYELLKEILQ